MAEEAQESNALELSDGPEYKVLASLFGLMLASAGLLAGTMFRERSFEYWKDDLISLLLLFISGRGFLMNSMQLARESMIYSEKKRIMDSFLAKQEEVLNDGNEPVAGQVLIAPKKNFSEEEVLEAVSKKIQDQREKAIRENKFT